MTYSYTQISQYLRCPRQYRYRYLDGWREKEDKAAMIFGRCFETALAAYFAREDATAAFFKEWSKLPANHHLNIARMIPGTGSITKEFICSNGLPRTIAFGSRHPKQNLQVELKRSLPCGGDFVSYVDAIGEVDGNELHHRLENDDSRYAEQPEGLLALDPQLICYSWMSGISDVALVVFVRKNAPEIQYLKTSIDEEQRREFGELSSPRNQIEAGQFQPHSGIRFPQNGCVSCPHLGLCLGDQQLMDSKLIRRPGASDLDWLDQLED